MSFAQQNNDAELLDAINICFKKNVLKTFAAQAALFACHFAVFSTAIFAFLLTGQTTTAMLVLGIPLALAAGAFMHLFHSGFAVILYKLYTRQGAVLGDLLSGVRDIKRQYAAGILFVLIELACLLAVAVVFAVSGAPLESFDDSLKAILFFVLVYCALLALCMAPFSFVWFELYNNRSIKPLEAFASSARLLKKNKPRLLILVMKSCGIFLLIAAVIYIFQASSILSLLLAETGQAQNAANSPAFFLRAVNFFTQGASGKLFLAVYHAACFVALNKAVYALAAFYAKQKSAARGADNSLESAHFLHGAALMLPDSAAEGGERRIAAAAPPDTSATTDESAENTENAGHA